LAAAVQRFNSLQRRAESSREPVALLQRTLAELSTALEEIRVAQEQIVENHGRLEQMQEQVRRQSERYWQLFDEIPFAYVVTNPDSTITEVNKAGAALLNVSQRFLVGKALSVFVCEGRDAFLAACVRVAEESSSVTMDVKLRPRERAPLTASARATGAGTHVRWVLRAHEAKSA